jgi:hypothetical protein
MERRSVAVKANMDYKIPNIKWILVDAEATDLNTIVFKLNADCYIDSQTNKVVNANS